MAKTRLIVLSGFAASGKSTIAQKYIAEHDLTLALEVDSLVNNIGKWHEHRDEVRQLSFDLAKSILKTYLQSGHDVILPYYTLSVDHIQSFESIANDYGAEYYEVILYNERATAIERLMKRGTWGESKLPLITEEDRPKLESDFDKMESVFKQRQKAVKIQVTDQTPDQTYIELMSVLAGKPS